MAELDLPNDYQRVLARVKAQVRASQLAATRVVNTELVTLYWSIGSLILDQQEQRGWGAKVIDRLAADLRAEFPDQTGFSPRNLKYMRALAAAWPEPIVQQPVARLPWGHITVLLDRLSTRDDRDWYAEQALAGGWSRGALLDRIKVQLRRRVGVAASNFDRALPPPDSDLAQQMTKDPYVFDFLSLTSQAAERQLEDALMDRLQQVLLELGRGFAFMGRQVRLEVNGDEFFLDLLFFHTRLLRHVVVELKIGKFRPEYLGQLGTYVAMVDGELRVPDVHKPTVGLLLCTDANAPVVQYALGGMAAPVAVAKYTSERCDLPDEVREVLPSLERAVQELRAPDASSSVRREP